MYGRTQRLCPNFGQSSINCCTLYKRADSGMDLIDALAGVQGERSVVELCLHPAFRGRHYSGLCKAIRLEFGRELGQGVLPPG